MNHNTNKKRKYFDKNILCLCLTIVANVAIYAQNWQLIQPAYATADAFVAGFSVKDYGATGDGVIDVTSIFQGRIDALGALGGGTLFVPEGKYVIKGNLILRKGVSMRGEWQKPTKGQPITGTILMAYSGPGDENAASLITMEPCAALQDMVIWYPEQNPDNVIKYPPTILMGEQNYFGNDYCNVKNITLINSYTGIQFSRVNCGSCPIINGIYGTPLSRGIEIDNIADVGRIENIHFSPAYWEGSGLSNAPATGSAIEKWIFSNGTGIVMRRNDWSYTCFVDIEGYNMGLHLAPSIASPGSSPNGHNYSMTFTRCNTGIYFEATSDVGIMYASVKMINCTNGIAIGANNKFPIQFHTCEINATQNAITVEEGSAVKLMMQKCMINRGQVIISSGTFIASDCDFKDSTHKIIIGNNARSIMTGDRFKDTTLIENNSIYSNVYDKTSLTVPDLPAFIDTLTRNQKPSRLVMYNATSAPFNAKNDNATDNTSAIQYVLDSAAHAGGGIVFLPPGKYVVLGTLTVPTGVELKGAVDVSTAPMGKGSILEVYSGKGAESGTPFIKLSSGSGLRGIVFDYPEQLGDNVPNFYSYPYCIQVTGNNVYIVNIGMRGTYNGIDLFTYKCDNHYLDYISGNVLKTGIKVGGNSSGGNISNLQFNPICYVYGNDSKWGYWSNYPSSGNVMNIYNYVKDNLNFLVLNNCSDETLYDDFHYGSQCGLVLSGASGIGLGLGIDGSRKSLVINSIGSSGFDFINSQIVAIDDLSGTCYIQSNSSFTSKTTFFNSDYWGFCVYGINMQGGELDFQLANFQYPGSTAFANISSGNVVMQNSAIMPISLLLNSGDEHHFSAESSVLDSSGIVKSNCALWKNNLSNSFAIAPKNIIDRTGWTAAASDNNAQAYLGIDGNTSTRWTSNAIQTSGQWYTIDMKANKKFNEIILDDSESPYDSPVGYSIYVSTDGINWGSAIVTGAGTTSTTDIKFSEQNARYIKIIQTDSSSTYWWSIYEYYVLNNTTSEPVTGINVFPTSVKLNVDSTWQLTDTITPNDVMNKLVSWSSSDTSIVKVDTNGLVTAVAVGSAVITVESLEGGEKATSFVSVSIHVSGISSLPTSIKLKVDSIQQLTATIAPANATFKGVTWNSSNTGVATVDENGKVTGIEIGSAAITVTSLDGNFTDTCFVTVLGNIKGFTVYAYNPIGWTSPEKIYWWGALPSDSLADGTWPGVNMDTVVNVTTRWYKYFFPNIISTNLIFDDGSGNQTDNLFRDSIGWFLSGIWYDKDPSRVTGISVSPTNVSLTSAGATQQLTATITPVYALNNNLIWSSSNTGVATVNQDGLVTAVATGSATITVTTLDGGKTATSVIHVSNNMAVNKMNAGEPIFEINPNPSLGKVYFNCYLVKGSEIYVRVYCINGTLVKSENQNLSAGIHRLKMNIDDLKTGIYFVSFSSNNFIITKKMIVK